MGKRRSPAAAGVRRRTRRRGAFDTAEAVILLGVLAFLLGGYWDVAWHIEIGRESFWSPPHFLLYLGVLIVLWAGAYSFVRAWRSGRKMPPPAPFIAFLGAALSIASAPIDDLWHRLYGLDVTILSPPHVMLIAGMAIAAFGSLVGFAQRANRLDPARQEALWRSTSTPWRARGFEAGILISGGVLLAVVLAVLGEYDFDVARYPVAWHPVLLCTLASFVLALTARTSGRVGAATLTAAVYTGVRALAWLELFLLSRAQPQVPLVLVAAPAMDLALWWFPRRLVPQRPPGSLWVPALGGAVFAAVLLLVQWPYTAAWNGVVWRPAVLAAAAVPAIVGAAVAATCGWWLGSVLRPVVQPAVASAMRAGRGNGTAAATKGRSNARRLAAAPAAPRWDGWRKRPGLSVLAAILALAAIGIVPAVRRGGAPATLSIALPADDRDVAGYLQFSPNVPVVGQPLTLRVVLNDPASVGGAVALPYESVRAGDVTRGIMQTTGERGTYQVTITPREPGRRWVSVFLEGDEGRVAASASLVVYRPEEAAGRAPLPARPLIIRPEPGPDLTLPPWLAPAAYAAIAVLIAAEVGAIAWALRRGARPVAPVLPAVVPAPRSRAPVRGRA